MNIKRRALRLATELGVGEHALDAYERAVEAAGSDPDSRFFGFDLEDVDERIRNYRLEDPEGRVLIPLTQGQERGSTYMYCLLAHAFRTRGYDPIVVLCDATLDVCLRKRVDDDDEATCAVCHRYGRSALDAFGLDFLHTSELLPADYSPPGFSDGAPRSGEYRGIDIAKYARSSAKRFLKKGYIDYAEEPERSVYRRFLRSCAILTDVAEALFERWSFDAVVAHHPAYLYGGVYLDMAVDHGVPARTMGAGFRDGTLMIGDQRNRSGLPQFSEPGFVADQLGVPLTADEDATIGELMTDRKTGDAVRRAYVADTSGSTGAGDRNLVGLFTNLMWDASLEAPGGLFDSPYVWVATTIDHFSERPDVDLVVKPHPAEAHRESAETMSQWIHTMFDPLPENVTVLEPDTDVNPYDLASDLDLGVVFNSTLGLEMAFDGIPVVVAGDTHYRGLGFTYDPDSRSEYRDFLDRHDSLDTTERMRKRARRYAHSLFVRKHIEFPAFYTTDRGWTEISTMTHDELKPGQENVDRIVEGILENRPVLT